MISTAVKQNVTEIMKGAKELVGAISLAQEEYIDDSRLLAESVMRNCVEFLGIVKEFSDFLESVSYLEE
ncbi:MAG: hypothetical protein Q4B90_05630 [Eubacteriales bacterium]|nr:hypothetical protein [Eubacteriales bacterium]